MVAAAAVAVDVDDNRAEQFVGEVEEDVGIPEVLELCHCMNVRMKLGYYSLDVALDTDVIVEDVQGWLFVGGGISFVVAWMDGQVEGIIGLSLASDPGYDYTFVEAQVHVDTVDESSFVR